MRQGYHSNMPLSCPHHQSILFHPPQTVLVAFLESPPIPLPSQPRTHTHHLWIPVWSPVVHYHVARWLYTICLLCKAGCGVTFGGCSNAVRSHSYSRRAQRTAQTFSPSRGQRLFNSTRPLPSVWLSGGLLVRTCCVDPLPRNKIFL